MQFEKQSSRKGHLCLYAFDCCPLQEHAFKIWKIRMWFCVHSFTLTWWLWLQCLYMSQMQQRRATANHPLPRCSWVVNDSHLISPFFLHAHPAHLMCTSSSQDLSLQWFPPIWKTQLLFLFQILLVIDDLLLLNLPGHHELLYCMWFFFQLTVRSLLAIIGKLNLFQLWVAYLDKICFACKWSIFILHVNRIEKWLLKLCLPFIKFQNDYALCLN